uniref:Beta-galactosidase n=1 Tax=Acrobeloides nanus TaxID=290746 RepID=A0A914DKA4_9BILA
MHYFRVHPDYWEDRMQKIRALGLNVLQTYVPWNWHETTEGKYALLLKKFVAVVQISDSSSSIKCIHLPGTVSTIDFGVSENIDIYNSFHEQDLYSGGAPHVCSEYWVIWYTRWGDTHDHSWASIKGGINKFKSNLEFMYYNLSASWNIYMIHGGTSFGFWNGADDPPVITTSSDWTAAISEEGDITDTYLAIRDFILNISEWEQQPLDVPKNNSKANYGQVKMTCIGTNLVSTLTRIQETCVSSTDPLSFEQINYGYGYVLYTTTLTSNGTTLATPNIRDYGYVYLNNVYQGVLLRENLTSLHLYVNQGDVLRILVENRGRNKNYQVVYDSKGLNVNGTGLNSSARVTLDGTPLQNWVQCGVNLTKEAIDSLSTNFFEKSKNSSPKSGKRNKNQSPKAKAASLPGVYVGKFIANEIQDTFFDSTGWGKGQLFINGYNLGHYWPLAGPQMTLYVPKPFLQQKNTVILIELVGGQQTIANFIDHKIWLYPKQATI